MPKQSAFTFFETLRLKRDSFFLSLFVFLFTIKMSQTVLRVSVHMELSVAGSYFTFYSML